MDKAVQIDCQHFAGHPGRSSMNLSLDAMRLEVPGNDARHEIESQHFRNRI